MPGTIVDMHVHTVRGASDSSLTPEQLTEVARRVGLTGVNICEHDRVWDKRQIEEFRQQSGLFVSRGMEVSTDMGHIIVIGLDTYLPGIRKARELRRAVDEAGGFMIVAHPFRHFFDPIHFRRDGRPPFEMTTEEAAERMPVFRLVDELEVANGGCTPQENQFALRVAWLLGKRGIGASDCHSTQGVGCFVTVFEEELRDPSALQRCSGQASLRAGQAHMLELLRAGRYRACEGLTTGELRPYAEQPLTAK
jgi:predicted metal-dependent phosphoesterase TrpH